MYISTSPIRIRQPGRRVGLQFEAKRIHRSEAIRSEAIRSEAIRKRSESAAKQLTKSARVRSGWGGVPPPALPVSSLVRELCHDQIPVEKDLVTSELTGIKGPCVFGPRDAVNSEFTDNGASFDHIDRIRTPWCVYGRRYQ